MQYLNNYLNKIIERGNVGLAESISATAEEVGNKYLKNFSVACIIALIFQK